jgi:hypothetical protein
MKLGVTLDILNQKDTPAFYADTLANRPAAGFTGRVFISTDTLDLYRDTGTTWVLLSPSSTGTITGSGAAGQVTYFSAASSITGSNDLFFDSVNGHLGIGTITPSTALTIFHDQNQIIQINQTTATNDTKIAFQNSGTPLWRIGNSYNAGANDYAIYDVVGAIQPLTIKKTSGQVLIGTSTIGSGKLVVASATSDNGIQIVGANAPSLRLDNSETGATKRVGLGISTATNNFIQGSADRDFCIFNGSTTAASPMLFGIYDAGLTNVQEAARISAARNFIVGSVTDTGQKLQITGTSKLNGLLTINAGNATNGILVDSGIANTDIQIFPSSSFSRISLRSQGTQADISIVAGASINFRTSQAGVNTLIGTTLSSAGGGVEYYASQNGASAFHKWFYNGGEIMRLTATNLLLGTTTDAGFRLDVNGTTRLNSTLTLSNSSSQISTSGGGNSNTTFLSNNGSGWNGFAFGRQTGALYTFEIRPEGNFCITYGAFYVTNTTQNAGNGTTPTPNSSAVLQADSTTKGFLPPRMTTAEKNAISSPATGLIVFDTTLGKLCVFSTTWQTVTSV